MEILHIYISRYHNSQMIDMIVSKGYLGNQLLGVYNYGCWGYSWVDGYPNVDPYSIITQMGH